MSGKQYKVLDLFAGAGGFSYGFKKLFIDNYYPFIISGAVEIDIKASETLMASLIRDGMPAHVVKEIVVTEDITKSETKSMLYNNCPEADIIIGGPPCQSFSLIGPRSGDICKKVRFANDHRDNLFNDYVEIVDHYRPQFFVFENVRGIASKKGPCDDCYIDIIIKRLESINYDLRLENSSEKYLVLNSADFGVPQLRERIFIIGNNKGMLNPIPKITNVDTNKSQSPIFKAYVSVRAAIGDLPSVSPKLTYTRNDRLFQHMSSDEWKDYINNENDLRDPGRDISGYHWSKFAEHYISCDSAGKEFLDFVKPKREDAYLTGHAARRHQLSDVTIYRDLPEGTSSSELLKTSDPELSKLAGLIKYRMDSFKDKYKKMAWDKPSLTIFAHLHKDGNRFIHPDSRQARTITTREAARLQSFPDDYVFMANGNMRFKQIGNAVPPLLAMAIAKAIYKKLKAN